MCNCYDADSEIMMRPGISGRKLVELLGEINARETWSKVIRPTLQGPVFTSSTEGRLMRWGFERPRARSINNALIEKRTTMWKKPWQEGRCLTPMSGWYEFTGPKGNMTCHLLEPEEPGMLLAAGLWEEHEEHGFCYTMVMTEADPESMLGKIHNRMRVILTPDDGERWLAPPLDDLQPLHRGRVKAAGGAVPTEEGQAGRRPRSPSGGACAGGPFLGDCKEDPNFNTPASPHDLSQLEAAAL